jgi:hypothetical protein
MAKTATNKPARVIDALCEKIEDALMNDTLSVDDLTKLIDSTARMIAATAQDESMDPEDMARIMKISTRRVYDILNDEDAQVPALRVGVTWKISRSAFYRWFQQRRFVLQDAA